MKRGPSCYAVPVIIGLVAAALVAMFAAVVWNEFKHPCIRHEDRASTCGGQMYCAFFDTKGMCIAWGNTPEYPCTVSVCMEREP